MVAVTLQGELEPRIADEDFHAAMHILNTAAQKSQTFALMDKPDGSHMLINITKITTVDQLEDDD